MNRLSLVGLKATQVTHELARNPFYITSYRDPIALVIPIEYASKREFYIMMEKIAGELFDE
jgi:hypothetical protein